MSARDSLIDDRERAGLRSPSDILATGAAWVAEHELTWLCTAVDSYAGALQHEREILDRATRALRYIVTHPNGVGDHHPSAVATAALNGEEIPNV